MGKQINVTIDNKKIIIDSDTPSFDELLSTVIEKKTYDFNQIIISCDDEKFDKESFKNALVSTIESLIKDISVDKEKLDSQLKKINEEKTALDDRNRP